MNDGYQLLPGFLSAEETAHWRARVASRRDAFKAVGSRGGLNLRYRVVDGHRTRELFPDLIELSRTRLRAAAEETVGRPLVPIPDAKRALRVQLYGGRHEGFRWHLDVSPYSALLTLEPVGGIPGLGGGCGLNALSDEITLSRCSPGPIPTAE